LLFDLDKKFALSACPRSLREIVTALRSLPLERLRVPNAE
jgi:uncharacterized protein YjeT (DUF2065 family)